MGVRFTSNQFQENGESVRWDDDLEGNLPVVTLGMGSRGSKKRNNIWGFA